MEGFLVPAPLNHEQFMRLFLQSERELLRYVMALVPNVSDARDVVQETALALWREIGKYDPSKPFIPWACRFALNEARVFLRKEFRQRRVLREDVATLLEQKRLAAAAELDGRHLHLQECLAGLPEDQRGLLRGYYFDDESVDALANRLSRSREAVYKSLQRIRHSLQQCVERKLLAEA